MNEQTKKPTGLPEKFFITFLIRNNCYQKFSWNLTLYGNDGLKAAKDYIKFINTFENLPKFIEGAFDWSKTVEGGIYWRKISDNWIEYLTSAIKLES